MSEPSIVQMEVEMPNELEPVYSNFAIIAHTPSEVMMDLIRVLPNTPKAKVVARVILTPMNAKLLLHALSENLSKYESQFGEIVVPTGLADQLFKSPNT